MLAFGKKPKKCFSLDIGNHYIKLCELKEKQNRYLLNAFGIERLADSSAQSKIAAIKKLVAESALGSNKVNLSVCGPSVIVRYILLPHMTKTQLLSAIKYEAEKYIPFDINEVILNAPILEEQKEDNKVRVLLVAAKKAFVNEYVNLVKFCGLEPQLVDVDSFALINAFALNLPDMYKHGICALLHIGSHFSTVNILKDGVSHFMRDITVGGKDITKAIADKLNMDFEAAEKLKCDPLKRQEEIFSIINPVLNNILGEISLSFSYYEDQLERGIDKVFLSGGTAKLNGLDGFLSNNLGLEVVRWDPAAKLELSPALDKEKLNSCLPMMAVSLGLALSSPERS